VLVTAARRTAFGRVVTWSQIRRYQRRWYTPSRATASYGLLRTTILLRQALTAGPSSDQAVPRDIVAQRKGRIRSSIRRIWVMHLSGGVQVSGVAGDAG